MQVLNGGYHQRKLPGTNTLANLVASVLLSAATVSMSSCNEDGLEDVHNNFAFASHLSAYRIFNGSPSDLKPSEGFHPYNLSTELFSDYALKQRLIKVPHGKQISGNNDDLLEFPDSTVLVKTFFYQNDFRNESKGRRIIETRLMVKYAGQWNVATYYWNSLQTEALLVNSGLNTTVNWIDRHGEPIVTSYHVPSARECVTCHSKNDEVVPIGPKIRNLHRGSAEDGVETDQLAHWEEIGLLTRSGSATDTLANWQDASQALAKRARAYLDVNCGHCHQPGGFAARTGLYLDYDHGNARTIDRRGKAIAELMRNGRMPLIGTTLVHEEGLELIQQYIRSLK